MVSVYFHIKVMMVWFWVAFMIIYVSDNMITNVTENNTGMCIKESSQRTYKIPNNNLYVRFEQAPENHNNEIVQTTK